MNHPEIPRRAYAAAEAAFANRANQQTTNLGAQLDAVVAAVAPIIVAAELRSFVEALREMVPVGVGACLDPQLVIETIAGDLERRANELDSPAVNR